MCNKTDASNSLIQNEHRIISETNSRANLGLYIFVELNSLSLSLSLSLSIFLSFLNKILVVVVVSQYFFPFYSGLLNIYCFGEKRRPNCHLDTNCKWFVPEHGFNTQFGWWERMRFHTHTNCYCLLLVVVDVVVVVVGVDVGAVVVIMVFVLFNLVELLPHSHFNLLCRSLI